MSSIIQKECIVFDINTYDKNEAILTLVKKLKEQEKITSIDNFYQDVLDREKIAPTAIGYNIGLPHGRTNNVIEPAVCFGRLNNEIVWNEETKEVANIIILIAVPQDNEGNLHMQILSKLARKLMHEDFRNQLLNSKKAEVYKLLCEGLEV
ncbi:PTS fructose transporter subunit IIABC [Thomasclavelia cocleata]|uniref:PTS system IIA component, Fru family n=1 Tax=Thomasclavelia cocleata TaxID=69824 RepID=A0A1I0H1B6_9FIRM|nr:fructose PTS transporter subunit IIA [Thomasclavelia cocleata]MCR1961825.1 fructose PTS transporter subunit IIA [Thomasclavelia cocleata]NDO42737.1 PTS sugar transporter subunit IIA [Thomasclavelia cocleata]PJN80370.1 PTS fructose transporter subunit IIABC [Thomasclavelia cocleata]SET77359.1 PTS system IIA component, Fru family [Thomasclavelia cocleata]